MVDRRTFLAAAIGAAAVRAVAHAQGQQQISPVPTPRDWSRLEPIAYPDPDIIALDPRFRQYIVFNTSIKRHHIGTQWAEGPAWSGVGRYLVWSDIPNNVQMRWIEEDGRVTTYRNPSGYSNGNTFDYEGRQLSCEHGGRRVVRYEPNGTVTTIAERFDGKRLNSPNDVVVNPDGGIWFTDPFYGIRGNYEGFKAQQESKESVYRVDGKSGQVAKVRTKSGSPTGCASRLTTRSCTSPIRARRARSKSGMSMVEGCATANVSCSSMSPGRERLLRQTASAATQTEISGRVLVPASRSSRRTAIVSG